MGQFPYFSHSHRGQVAEGAGNALAMLTIRAMSNGEGYSARHLEHNDYFSEKDRIKGEWLGYGAELLKLQGEVRTEQFEAIRQGLDPATGEFLRPRRSADRIAADGTKQSSARSLYDFTISAPKSVSIMAQLGGDERLAKAHQTAVSEAVKELESLAATRVRKGGLNESRTTGNLVIAAYFHNSSRELDPQLHTHLVSGNLTYDGVENRWKALQAQEIYDSRAYLTEVYRGALAREVRSLGYEIEDRIDERGRDLGFDIKGVPDELLSKYSQRSEQRDRAIDAFVEKHGRMPTDNETALLVRETRSAKLTEISTEQVQHKQYARLTPGERGVLREVRENARAMEHTREYQPQYETAERSLEYAKAHTFERVSVAHERDLLTEALRYDRGGVNLEQLKGTLHLQEESGAVLRAGKEVATKESLERERSMVSQVNRGVGRFEALGHSNDFTASDRLRSEQKEAVEFVLKSRDFAVNLRGAAGTGKTAVLQEMQRGLQESGRKVIAVAPTRSATEELEKVGFSGSMTIERLLQDKRAQTGLRGAVLVIDEAGMISGRQMSELLNLAERQSTRILFSGDTRQIQSVESGDALRVLEKESQLKSISLNQVQRQTVPEYREAVQELRVNPKQGFERLEQIGAIREVDWQEKPGVVAQVYREALSQRNAKGEQQSVLVVASTHEQIDAATFAIRTARRDAGEIGGSVPLERHVPLNYTTAQKKEPRNYQKGQVLTFHRATKGIQKNESLEVVRVQGRKILARNESGEHLEITAKQVGAFQVFERRSIDVAPNDKLLLGENRSVRNFRTVNGELVTVAGVDRQGRIQLQDGRTLPADYKQFSHGYAVTAHRSQGKTVDRVIISADNMRKDLFYVAASRGRESVTVVTSDKEVLRESVARSGERQSATELERKAQENRPGTKRGLEAARLLARQAVQREPERYTEQFKHEHAVSRRDEREEYARNIIEAAERHRHERGHGHGIGH